MTGTEIALAGYLAFGQLIQQGQQEIVKHAGLQVIHADGAVTLRLGEVARDTREDGGRFLGSGLRTAGLLSAWHEDQAQGGLPCGQLIRRRYGGDLARAGGDAPSRGLRERCACFLPALAQEAEDPSAGGRDTGGVQEVRRHEVSGRHDASGRSKGFH